MFHYTIDEEMITITVKTKEELVKYITKDAENFGTSSFTIFNDKGDKNFISIEELNDCLFIPWGVYVFSKYGVPTFAINPRDKEIQQDRANWEKEKKQKDEKLKQLILSRIENL